MTKKALLYGINYKGTNCPLSGCWNDPLTMKKLLLQNGYSDEHIEIMTDEPQNRGTPKFPTVKNFYEQVRKFIGTANAGDQLFFHYSGHGTQTYDRNSDEPDRKDEAICLLNDQNGIDIIIDDILYKELVANLPQGVKLFCLMDCCCSGTILDLPFYYVPKGNVKREKIDRALPKDVIMVSGCLDDQSSADAYIEGKSQGALTYMFNKTFTEMRKGMNWRDFITVLDYNLHNNRYSQISEISYFTQNDLDKPVEI
jgi:hypothetical protein